MTDRELADRIAIEDRLAACTQAGDARKADAYAECFTPDGVLDLTQGGGEAIEGREAIRRWMGGAAIIPQPGGGTPGFVSHHLTTCRIELTGENGATARTYWLVTSAAGLDHNGYYDDRLRKVGGAWLLEYRRPRTLWISPASVLHG
jgi:hypothetical protein